MSLDLNFLSYIYRSVKNYLKATKPSNQQFNETDAIVSGDIVYLSTQGWAL